MNSDVTPSYDYIIVGGGSAGCVLANRLSARSSNRVLLCEAGADMRPGEEPDDILDGYPGYAYLNKSYLWPELRVTTQAGNPQGAPALPLKLRAYEQARILGGGSSINGQFANRGAPSDYDRWEELGAKGWGWEGVLPYFRKLEHDTDFEGPLHGAEGPVAISRVMPDRWPGHTKAVAGAFAAAGYEYLADQNGAFQDGYFPIAMANLRGRRVAVASQYLSSEVRKRHNLEVRTRTSVSRLLMRGATCQGVEIVLDDGSSHRLTAREVIVAAGAIHTPAILLRAGLGPAGPLRKLGIPLTADRPGVGQHLMDHPAVALASHIKPAARVNGLTRRHMLIGLRYSSRLMESLPGDMFVFGVSKSAWHAVGDQIGCLLVFVNQTFSSDGVIELQSPDWRVEPSVNFNLLSDNRDLRRLVDGFRRIAAMQVSAALGAVCDFPFPMSYNDKVKQIGAISRRNRYLTWLAAQLMDLHPRMRDAILERYALGDFRLDQLLTSDEALEAFIRRDSIGLWHASCSCRMGGSTDPMAVTNPAGKVYGVQGLRIVDASIFPVVPRANTNIPTMMAAEKISDAILAGQ